MTVARMRPTRSGPRIVCGCALVLAALLGSIGVDTAAANKVKLVATLRHLEVTSGTGGDARCGFEDVVQFQSVPHATRYAVTVDDTVLKRRSVSGPPFQDSLRDGALTAPTGTHWLDLDGGTGPSPCANFLNDRYKIVSAFATTPFVVPEVFGRLIDYGSLAPLPGVKVRAGRARTITFPDGLFHLILEPFPRGKLVIKPFDIIFTDYFGKTEKVRVPAISKSHPVVKIPTTKIRREPSRGCLGMDGVYVSRSQPSLALRYVCGAGAVYVKWAARSFSCGSGVLTPQAVDPRNNARAFYSQFRLGVRSDRSFSGQGTMFTRGTQVNGRLTAPTTATVTITDGSCPFTVSAGDLRYSHAAGVTF
jgi:hypothetical protein